MKSIHYFFIGFFAVLVIGLSIQTLYSAYMEHLDNQPCGRDGICWGDRAMYCCTHPDALETPDGYRCDTTLSVYGDVNCTLYKGGVVR